MEIFNNYVSIHLRQRGKRSSRRRLVMTGFAPIITCTLCQK